MDVDRGLNGYVDFLIGQTYSQLYLEAPIVVLVEAKKEDLKSASVTTVYGTVTSGTVWIFLKLDEKTVTIDLTEYSVNPIEKLLGFLVWMVGKRQAG